MDPWGTPVVMYFLDDIFVIFFMCEPLRMKIRIDNVLKNEDCGGYGYLVVVALVDSTDWG